MYVLQQSKDGIGNPNKTWKTMRSYGVNLEAHRISDLIWMVINAEYNPLEFRGTEFRIVEEIETVEYRTLE